jgi:hypothetical protein
VDFPPALLIKSIKDWCICHFKDLTHKPQAPPHYYVIIPIFNSDELIICIITSQIEHKKSYYQKKRPEALKSLVFIGKEEFSFLIKDSLIDCNQAEMILREHLIYEIHPNPGFKITERNIPDKIKHEIKEAIQESPLVRRYIKKLLN